MAKAPAVCKQPSCPEFMPCPTHKRTPWQRNTYRKLPPNWPAIRKAIKTRDNYQCTIPMCPTPRHKLEVDHIGDHDNHNENNLRTLCQRHHQEHTNEQATQARQHTERLE